MNHLNIESKMNIFFYNNNWGTMLAWLSQPRGIYGTHCHLAQSNGGDSKNKWACSCFTEIAIQGTKWGQINIWENANKNPRSQPCYREAECSESIQSGSLCP